MRWVGSVILLLALSQLAFGAKEQSSDWLDAPCPRFFKPVGQSCVPDFPYQTVDEPELSWRKVLWQHGPVNRQQIALGRLLFFDPILSVDHDMACASCHHPDLGLSDGFSRRTGRQGNPLAHNAPSLWNVGLKQQFTWTGRHRSLLTQNREPMLSIDELDLAPAKAVHRLQDSRAYSDLFTQAFGTASGNETVITEERLLQALAAFQVTLVSLGSRYDRYILGDQQALTPEEINGWQHFRSFSTRCAECHAPPLFSNDQLAQVGSGERVVARNILIPSLRNLATTGPYFDEGQFASIRQVLRFYNRGGGRRAANINRRDLHWHVRAAGLSSAQLNQLEAFLLTIHDESAKPEIPTQLPSGIMPVVVPIAVQGETSVAIGPGKPKEKAHHE